jgi:peptide/nickel transport system ATP-binding protein
VLRITGLTVAYPDPVDGLKTVVDEVSLTVKRGEVLGLVGESGSGKTQTAWSILRLLPPAARIVGGAIHFDGTDLSTLGERELSALRGRRIAYVPQEPMSNLDPSFTIGHQLVEPMQVNLGFSKAQARDRAIDLLAKVGIPQPERTFDAYPHQISGGMAQRVLIAGAISCDPDLLIADEPTTALDVTVQAEVLDLLRNLQDEFHMGVILVTHDFGVVADLCDRVAVMRHGRIVETGTTRELFAHPEHPYTRQLLDAILHDSTPRGQLVDAAEEPPVSTALLDIRDVVVEYPARGVGGKSFRALHGVSVDVNEGECVGLVGESGSGKTTLGRAVLGLAPVTAGEVLYRGRDIAHLGRGERRALGSQIQVVFQDPYTSLNPSLTVEQILAEPLTVSGVPKREATQRITRLFDLVHLPKDAGRRLPREFSGGQRQRVAVARALALEPQLIVCDEPVSALDLSTQARVLDLFREIQDETGVAYLFISHDLDVVRHISHRVAVMFRGEIVEFGDGDRVTGSPEHAYTQRLFLASPVADPDAQARRREERRRFARDHQEALA